MNKEYKECGFIPNYHLMPSKEGYFICPNIGFCNEKHEGVCECFACDSISCQECRYWDKYVSSAEKLEDIWEHNKKENKINKLFSELDAKCPHFGQVYMTVKNCSICYKELKNKYNIK